jgi:hypothetical protein
MSLNVHRADIGYFEWHRMVMQGIAHKALVISDPCLAHPYFEPGTHYLEEIPRRIPNLVDWLLGTRRGRLKAEQVRYDGYARLAEVASAEKVSARLAQFLLAN